MELKVGTPQLFPGGSQDPTVRKPAKSSVLRVISATLATKFFSLMEGSFSIAAIYQTSLEFIDSCTL
jgi:hypothetical protein